MDRKDCVKTILIIDDDDDTAAALSCILESTGYRVRRAADGDEGLRMAAAERPDLIILDFMMPVKDGFCTCRELSDNPDLRRVPIIALTAFGQDIGEEHGLPRDEASNRIREYLEKPVEPNILLERVAATLKAGPR
jgi:DNA-binding response OmpR family regulator